MAFGAFTVHAGDFTKSNEHHFINGMFIMRGERPFAKSEIIPISHVDTVDLATEENVKRLGDGPVGLLAGLLLGGRGKDVTFVCVLKDGRRFRATAPSKVYILIMKSRF